MNKITIKVNWIKRVSARHSASILQEYWDGIVRKKHDVFLEVLSLR